MKWLIPLICILALSGCKVVRLSEDERLKPRGYREQLKKLQQQERNGQDKPSQQLKQ
jgi:hypothetical protein